MNSFAHAMAAMVRRLDPARGLSSGYSLPRAAALHLARRPEWAKPGPDWTPDTVDDLKTYLQETQKDFDIVSIHVYPQARRFQSQTEAEVLRTTARIVHSLGKKLFVGEFGDTSASPFLHDIVKTIGEAAPDYAAIWVWEFYQTAPNATLNTEPTRYTVEPGLRDDVIALLQRPSNAAGRVSATPRVVLTWPLPCANVDRPMTLAAVASDGAKGAASVEFLVDGQSVGVSTTAPHVVEFDPTPFPKKLTTLEVRAKGANGLVASDTSEVLLNHASGLCTVPQK
jgi:hypothetical protein